MASVKEFVGEGWDQSKMALSRMVSSTMASVKNGISQRFRRFVNVQTSKINKSPAFGADDQI